MASKWIPFTRASFISSGPFHFPGRGIPVLMEQKERSPPPPPSKRHSEPISPPMGVPKLISRFFIPLGKGGPPFSGDAHSAIPCTSADNFPGRPARRRRSPFREFINGVIRIAVGPEPARVGPLRKTVPEINLLRQVIIYPCFNLGSEEMRNFSANIPRPLPPLAGSTLYPEGWPLLFISKHMLHAGSLSLALSSIIFE